jgi:sulfonate transport system permease protein
MSNTSVTLSGAITGDRVGRAAAGTRRRRIALSSLIGLLLPLAILGAWEIASHLHWVSKVFLPTPERTVASFFDLLFNEGFYFDLVASLSIVGQAFFYGAALGLLFGAGAGMSKVVERVFGPTLDGIRHIPPIAWLPLVVLWAGVGPLGKVIVISKVVFFPVFLNTLQGIRNVPQKYVDLAKVLTLTRWQFTRRIIIPDALPSILVGIRYGASLAWALVVVAEGLSGMKGIGFLIFRAQALLMTDQLLVCMVVIGLIGFLIDYGMRHLEHRLLRWKQGFEGH